MTELAVFDAAFPEKHEFRISLTDQLKRIGITFVLC